MRDANTGNFDAMIIWKTSTKGTLVGHAWIFTCTSKLPATFIKISHVDFLNTILAILAKLYQILTTSGRPRNPWRDSYQDLTKTIQFGRSYLIAKIIKNTIPSVQAVEIQFKGKGSFHPTTITSTRFRNQNASTWWDKFFLPRICEKLR